MENIIKTLLKMGYRKYPDKKSIVYAKPVGYSLLFVNLDKKVINCVFLGVNEEIHFWSHENLDLEKNIMEQIKIFEAYSARYNAGLIGDFEFLTMEQHAEDLLF